MEPANALIGHTEPPSPQEVAAALGPAAGLWNELIDSIANKLGVNTQQWNGVYPHKYGWSLILQLKKRRILYLVPCQRSFRVTFLLSDKAVAAANATRLPKKVQDALAQAPRYPEGTGLRLTVNKAADLPPIRKIAEIKLAN